MSKVYRVFVEKRKDYAVEAVELLHNIKHQLKITGLEDLKVVNRYDVQGVSVEALNEGINIILKQANKSIPKDKFSAFEYGLYYIKQEEESKRKKRKKFVASEW